MENRLKHYEKQISIRTRIKTHLLSKRMYVLSIYLHHNLCRSVYMLHLFPLNMYRSLILKDRICAVCDESPILTKKRMDYMANMKGLEHHNGQILKDRICVVCGEKFDVKLGKGGVIPIQFFFSRNLGESLDCENREYWECETCSGHVFEKMKEWMRKNWGERCADYVEGCSLCEAWKCFDYLFSWTVDEQPREDVEQK
jgi:hypothetical protein